MLWQLWAGCTHAALNRQGDRLPGVDPEALAGLNGSEHRVALAARVQGYVSDKGYLDFGSRTLTPTAGVWVNKP